MLVFIFWNDQIKETSANQITPSDGRLRVAKPSTPLSANGAQRRL